MAPQKQKAASYELIEAGGEPASAYGSVEPASADEEYDKYDGGETPRRKLLSLVAPASATGKFLFVGNDRSSAPSPCPRPVPPSRTTTI